MARSEADRRRKVGYGESLLRRPEIGAFIVMIVVLVSLGWASGGWQNNLNFLDSTAFSPLGVRNNTRIVAQLGIIAIGAFMLMVAGEFDLSIGSMIGFAGMSLALLLKWGLHITIPFTDIVLVDLDVVPPSLAFLLTLGMTLAFGWLIGNIVVRSGLPSFIVTLAFLFFLRGLTEVCYRFLNRAPGDRSGSTQVSDLPDFKNLIDLERFRSIISYPAEQAIGAAKGCLSVFERPLNNSLAKLDNVKDNIANLATTSKMSPEQLARIKELAPATTSKEELAAKIAEVCKVDPNTISLEMERVDAQKLSADDLLAIFSQIPAGRAESLRNMLEADATRTAERLSNIKGNTVTPASINDIDVAKEFFMTLPTKNPVADLFGGNILEWLANWTNVIGWNITERTGAQWIDGLYAVVGWWIFVALVAWFVMQRTKAGNWIYSTGGNLQAAKANGVPTDGVKISLFMTTAACATIFAATQVFDTNSADAAKGNLKELEAIATAVVGGAILTGGFGSIWGVVFGAIIFGLAQNALFYIPWLDGAYSRMFLGSILLAAALMNESIRKRFTGGI